MIRSRCIVVALTFVVAGATAYLSACVGSDPDSATPAPDAGTSSSGGSSGTSSSGGSSGTSNDGGLTCPDGELACEGACINPKTTKKHCGRCTHDCGSGDCNAGTCRHVLIAGDPALPDAGSFSITSLATDQTSDDPKALAQKVFWSVSASTSANGVYQDNVLGGTTLKLSTAATSVRTNVVAIDATKVVWSRFAVTGGPPVPQPVVQGTVGMVGSEAAFAGITGQQIQSIAYDVGSKYVIGSFKVDGTDERAFRCGPSDGTPACAAIGTAVTGDPGGNVALDATNIYFAASAAGIIYSAAKDGTGSTSTYKSNELTPALLRVDGNDLFWGSSTDKVIRRGGLGTAGTVTPVATSANAPSAIAADATNVYWTDPVLGTVNYAPRAGTGPNTPYVTLGPTTIPMRLVRDTGFLYFTHNGGIYRVALP